MFGRFRRFSKAATWVTVEAMGGRAPASPGDEIKLVQRPVRESVPQTARRDKLLGASALPTLCSWRAVSLVQACGAFLCGQQSADQGLSAMRSIDYVSEPGFTSIAPA
jgi:hypothetical protein